MSINERQNSKIGLDLLRAAQVANLRVARIESARMILSILLMLATVASMIHGSQSNHLLAIIGSSWAIISTLILVPSSRQLRNEACLLQEQFDTYVFDIPWNRSQGSKINMERIHELSYRFKGKVETIVDWYPHTDAPWPLNALICQRANISYDIRLRERWRRIVVGFLTVWLSTGIAVGAITSMTVWSILSTWFAPSCAAIIFGYEIVLSQARALYDRRLILPGIDRAIETLREENRENTLGSYEFLCRTFQDALFDARKRASRVPSWFYRILRERNEQIMRIAAVDAYNSDT
ncbi:S-4TM family putative pore-forming effector [Amycolatopsis sp. NPDC059027]|uniref:S-4TM family putative pore-forming effector n=1 Tax=unclassified Amycolatopsis TaxID=2618356 RepID=UPI00366F0608